MGMFDDPNTMALLGAAQGFGNASLPSRMPVPFGYVLGQGLGGAAQGAQQAQAYQSANMQNQMQKLALQKQQTLQPLQLQMMMGMLGQNPGGQNTPSPGQSPMSGAAPLGMPGSQGYDQLRDQMIQAGRMKMGLTGDPTELEKAYQAAFENDPLLAGAKTSAQQAQTIFKTPQGTYAKGGDITSQPSGAYQGAAGALPVDKNEIPSINASELQPPEKNNSMLPKAGDGKPLLSSMTNMFKPDPNGMPKYQTPNTESGVKLQNDMQSEDVKADGEMTSNLSSLSKEQYRLNQLAKVYQQTQSGTLLAQNPDTANQLMAWGVIKDPSQIHDLAMIQKGVANQAIQIIQQIKDANANMGSAPSRLFGSEISNLQDKAENAGSRPEANYEVITDAMGLANHASDMAKGWDSIGGLGNRIQNGNTMRPSVFARKFIEEHDPQSYKDQAMKTVGPFKGMEQAAPAYNDGAVAVNHKTGAKLIRQGGKWVPQ